MTYPAIVALIAFAFTGILLKQYLQRGKPYRLVWTVAMTIGGLAALSFVLFLATDRGVLFFRLYYICGALLMAAYMGLGSVYLLAPRRAADVIATLVGIASVIGLILMLVAPINAAALHGNGVEAGTKLVSGPVVVVIILLNTFGAAAVIGGALWSAWRLFRRQGPVRLLMSNLLIASGTILASLAGTLARGTGSENAFWGLLAAGFVVLFGGFLLTTRPSRTAPIPASRVAV